MSEIEITKLKEEIEKLKKEASNREWGIKKTNEGIKLLYKELEQKNRELQQLDRMKSEFVSTVSHELRTPMAIIKESLSQILEGILGDVPDPQRRLLNMALNNINRLARIINNLLDISKIEAGETVVKREDFDITAAAREVIESFAAHVNPKGLELDLKAPDQPLIINADRDKIIQVFTNLIGNAVKFTAQGGITLTLEDKGETMQAAVVDTGTGISESDLPKVFGKFQQFGRKDGPGDKGTGLGLAISKGIVELHKGSIWVESKLNEGTKFVFILPKKNTSEGSS